VQSREENEMFEDTRPEYPPEFDEPDSSEWEGDILNDIAKHIGIGPAAEALRLIDKYGSEGATVSVRLPNGECFYVPDDLSKIRQLDKDEPVAAWIVHGIAWDGTDWEYSVEVATVKELDCAIQDFANALAEHRGNCEEPGAEREIGGEI
jgi:hypothetical protein